MTKIGGYVNMCIEDQYVECMACDEEVRVESIDNLLSIDPTNYGIVLYCEPCKCGFKNVYEYIHNPQYSHQLSVEESNDNDEGKEWHWNRRNYYEVDCYTEEEE